MDRDEILKWTKEGYDVTRKLFKFPQEWWPNAASDQSDATLWALSIMIEAAKSRCVGKQLVASFCGGQDKVRKLKLIEHAWSSKVGDAERSQENAEILVDFSVHHWDSAAPVQFTGESEMYAAHGILDSMSSADDYSWDFFKLLVVPSPSRVFVARVGGGGGDSVEARCRKLAATFQRLVDRYGLAYLRPNDELGGVIIPSGSKSWDKSWVMWLERGRLRIEQKSPWAND